MSKYGPSRRDLRYRAGFAIAGLSMTAGALAYRGWPTGPGGWEAIGIALVFFGGTLIWAMRKLIRQDYPDET
ncbi:hypothetical protein [Roseobacter ponti]|uniref:Uncharacterized protein n=1 Tax=Roseobacter ponti TaxID=1891787 RepID=A0A858T0E6_9RHOB|nr:hypothetical protein [Roseobacter ponti]QJF52666.1 hypothetical protein G3256_16555 [Roseobacter ponti]